jgi:prostamide/prostaglandin F2alpha synthase
MAAEVDQQTVPTETTTTTTTTTTTEPEKPAVVTEAEKIGKLVVKKVPGLEEVEISSMWQDQTVVITFFRRFGCIFCRQAAKDISIINPILEKHGVKLIGIGIDEIGLADFDFFAGDLFIDPSKDTYKALGYKRFGYFTAFTSLFSKSSREAYSKSRANKISGNMKGDTFQNGGTLVVKKGGEEVLLSYRSENPADYVSNQAILNALGITDPIPEPPSTNGTATTNGAENGEKSKEDEETEKKDVEAPVTEKPPTVVATNEAPEPVAT